MNVEEFRHQLFTDIDLNTKNNNNLISSRESFIQEVSNILSEKELFDDINYLYYEGTGSRNRKIAIDGYLYNELDDNLCLFISLISQNKNQIETLTQTVAQQYLRKASSLVFDAQFIFDNCEESSDIYDLLHNILNSYKSVRSYGIYLLTDYEMSKNINYIDDEIINGKKVEYHIIDINRLYEYVLSNQSKEELVIDLQSFDGGISYLSSGATSDYTAYLCSIKGITLASLYNKYGSRLLEGNVRSFLQTKGKVNKGIRNTILNNPEMFFAYNNGIAVTASSVEIDEITNKITSITGMQIVNGGQTTASLGSALLNDIKENSEQQIKKINVPMKLSIVSHEKALELIPEISRYANSQNKVSDADLLSNHPFHRRIEELSRQYIAPACKGMQYGTYWYYERAKGQYRQETYKSSKSDRDKFEKKYPKNQMFTKTELAKYMNIKLLKPHIASAGSQKSFIKFSEFVSDEWKNNSDNFNEQYYKELIALAILYKETDSIIKRSTSWYTGSYKANIILYTLSIIIYNILKMNKTINYQEIWNKQSLSNEWINLIEKVAKIVYEFLTDENRKIENVTEWAKRETCWNEAKNLQIELSSEFVNNLVSAEDNKENLKLARKEQRNTNKTKNHIAVINLGGHFWLNLYNWNLTKKIYSEKEIDILQVAINIDKGKIPSEAQSDILVNMLEKAKDNGYTINR